MKLLRFKVAHQRLSGGKTKIVSGSIDYVEAEFDFTPDWTGLDKWAHFSKGDTAFDVNLINDRIEREQHLNLEPGIWEVKLHGDANENGEVSMRITTDTANITVENYGDIHEGGVLPEVAATAAEQIAAKAQDAVAKATEALEKANAVKSAADAGDFNGENGYTPEIELYQFENTEEGTSGFTLNITGKNGMISSATVFDGKKGEPGHAPKRGTDYWTEEDKEEIIREASEGVETGKQGPQGDKGDTGAQGPAGKDGTNGKDGKSAYEYAVDGGFGGTESEFAETLATDPREFIFEVTRNQTDGNTEYVSNKSYDEVYAAIIAGRTVKALYNGEAITGVLTPLVSVGTSEDGSKQMIFMGAFGPAVHWAISLAKFVNTDIVYSEEYVSLITINGDLWDGMQPADFTGTINNMITAKIPKTLPNPNKITFTGAVSGSYDGSSAVTINVPTAFKNPSALKINGTTYDGSSAVDMTSAINSLIDMKLGVIENGSY